MFRYTIPVVAALAGCGSVDVITAARLAATSPLDADPAGFAVTADLPEGLQLRPEGLVLELAAERADLGRAIGGRYVLTAQSEDGREVWRVDPGDLSELRMVQTTIRDWEADAPDATTGSLGITVDGCAVGVGPDPDGRLSIFLRTSLDKPLRPLIRNAPLRDVIALAGDGFLSPCDAPLPR